MNRIWHCAASAALSHAPHDERPAIDGFALHHFVEIGAERIVAEHADDERRVGTREGRGRPFDEAREVVQEYRLHLVFAGRRRTRPDGASNTRAPAARAALSELPSHLSEHVAFVFAARRRHRRTPGVDRAAGCDPPPTALEPSRRQPCEAHVELRVRRHHGRGQLARRAASCRSSSQISRQVEARAQRPDVVGIVAQRVVVDAHRIGAVRLRAAGLPPRG